VSQDVGISADDLGWYGKRHYE